jgi:tripartite-type tricarboxylate transporter receptor subunit TctC
VVADRMVKTGILPLILTPEQFDARIRTEIAANTAIARAAGIQPQ